MHEAYKRRRSRHATYDREAHTYKDIPKLAFFGLEAGRAEESTSRERGADPRRELGDLRDSAESPTVCVCVWYVCVCVFVCGMCVCVCVCVRVYIAG